MSNGVDSAYRFLRNNTGWKLSLENHQNKWLSPAKLNLFLHITGRREDGYHLLQTVFQLLDYGDEMWFSPSNNAEVLLETPLDNVPESDNLIIRAARLLQQHCNVGKGACIGIDKKLPMGGGLGGGSSNAATTLVALNKLWGTGLSRSALAGLGLQLGADVPVFVHGHSAWAEGVGEKLQVLSLPDQWFVVLDPGVHVATAELFMDPQLTRDCAAITIRAFHSGARRKNVFEPLVCKQYPKVNDAFVSLTQAAISCNVKDNSNNYQQPCLTGTGACVFLPCGTEAQARNVLATLPSVEGGFAGQFIAKGVNSFAVSG